MTRCLVKGFLFEDSCEEEFSCAVAGQESHTRGVSCKEAVRAAARVASFHLADVCYHTGEVWSFVVTGKR